MTAAQLIAELRKLPPNAEVALLAASGFARPPELERINIDAGWRTSCGNNCGLTNPHNAFLIRPAKEILR